jgi:hypothetical protein
MKPGHAPQAVAGQTRRPANFTSGSALVRRQRPEMRGKGDSPVRSVCSFLASTRAATVSSSAHSETESAAGDMLVG